jgi:hypothetical protein
MDDNCYFYGNWQDQTGERGDTREAEYLPIPRPLVEETISIRLCELRIVFGRKALERAAESAQPVQVHLAGNVFPIHILSESHQIPNRRGVYMKREARRLWICCIGCHRRSLKLYTYPKFPGSNLLYMPLCRSCHGLTYMSRNCSGNRWWREIVRPLKQLLRRRVRLLAMKPTPKVRAELEEADRQIWILRQRVEPKSPARLCPPTGSKRRYRDLNPILRSC